MLPAVDEQVLRDNPDFAKLYKTLTSSILNRDGTTRQSKEIKDAENVRKVRHIFRYSIELTLPCLTPVQQADQVRLKAVKHQLLTYAIETASPSDPARSQNTSSHVHASQSSQQSEALLNLLHILPTLLDPSSSTSISADDAALLLTSKPLSDLDALLPELTSLLSANLHSSALSLARLTHANTPPASLHRHIPALPQDLAELKEELASAQSRLLETRIRTTNALASLLQRHVEALTLLVRTVEAKHGAVANSLDLRAQEVTLKAQRTEAEAGRSLETLHKEMFSLEAVSALANYGAHLRDAKIRGAERVRNLQRELDDYGVGGRGDKEMVMREMARAHEEIGRQVDEVTKDLERLRTEA
jgi:hypothetical protein